MERQLLYPRDFATTILRCDMSQGKIMAMLEEVWGEWRCFLQSEWRESKEKFCRAVLQWTDYLCMPEDYHGEQDAIDKDMKDFGVNGYKHFYEDFEPISYAKYLWIRLHFVLPMKSMTIHLGTFLRNQRLSETDDKMLSFCRCLDFYHIQTQLNDGTPCELATTPPDTSIVFYAF